MLFVLQNSTTFFLHSFIVLQNVLISYTQNDQNLEFTTGNAFEYKTKRQVKAKRRQKKMTFLLASHQSTFVSEKHRSAYHKRVKKTET